ncbi:hypothetical protein ACFT7S_16730 [Streptomyces sp. NPDC057136]|uniref:hypothetical protein n=1 Tax=Streptomyces sp. NPDC057136 TaxID=3346029 RepID=UPI0036298524
MALDLLAVLHAAVVTLKAPLEQADREQGWTDELRREFQEEISVSRSVLSRHGPGMVRHLSSRFDAWMEREGVRQGRLQHLVSDVQRQLLDARSTA